MARSLGYTAYRALSRRRPAPVSRPADPRPPGELIWMHAPDWSRVAALCDLAARLKPLRPDVRILMTTPMEMDDSLDRTLDCIDRRAVLTDDHPISAGRFMAHWTPDLCLWAGAGLLPNHIHEASENGLPMVLLDADARELRNTAAGWASAPLRHTLSCFDNLMAVDSDTQTFLRKSGVPTPRVSISERLRAGVMPPPCSDAALAEMMAQVAGRPIWLAANVPFHEVSAVLDAHIQATRLSHRLLLILSPDAPDQFPALHGAAVAKGLRAISDTDPAGIEDSTQVLVTEDSGELGLWYRLSPLTYLGGTLTKGNHIPNPLEPAALGSAVLFGQYPGTQEDACDRLAGAGAALQVSGADSLGQAVLQLIAPDRVAGMALAGWQVVTEGAHLTETLLDKMQDMLDLRMVAHARS